jgi:hypothetical protein
MPIRLRRRSVGAETLVRGWPVMTSHSKQGDHMMLTTLFAEYA